MTRRQLGKLAAAGALAQAAAHAAEPSFPEEKGLDPVAFTKELYASAPLKLTFRAQTRDQALAWQKKLRPKVVELIGGFPEKRVPLNAQILETRDFPGYRREKFLFESRPGSKVAGYLLLPKNAPKPVATVVCIAGHGRGVDDVVGIDAEGRDRTDKPAYQHDFAIQTVEHGMAAVALEPMAFGWRRDAKTRSKGPTVAACQPVAGSALLLGETMIAWRVWDVMRAIDWIETRPELDAKRVGCMGISGGGTCTLFSAALEPRIKAAMVSCYLNTFLDSIMSISHCIDNYVPGILKWAEMYDVAGLIAPKPLFAESGLRDPIFPIAASRASYDKVKAVYDVMGAGSLLDRELFDSPHEFHGVEGLKFLAKHLA